MGPPLGPGPAHLPVLPLRWEGGVPASTGACLCLWVSIVITSARFSTPSHVSQATGGGTQPSEPTTTREGGPGPGPHPGLHLVPGEGAGPAADRHSHVTACIQVAALNANPGPPRKRPSGRAHAVEGWSLREEGICWSSREGLPAPPAMPHPMHTVLRQPIARPNVHGVPGVRPGDQEVGAPKNEEDREPCTHGGPVQSQLAQGLPQR